MAKTFREYLGLPEPPEIVPHFSFPAKVVRTFERILDYLDSTLKVVTTGELHVYADGTNGDDGNSGLNSSKPKKTLQAVFDLIPDIVKHNTAVHLSGNFVDMGNVSLIKSVEYGAFLIIDGGSSVTAIDDNSGSNYSSTDPETSAGSIGDSVNASWTIDEFAGYIVEIISGDAIGDYRLIQGNTSDTIIPCIDFSADPGVGAAFRIVRPSTTFSGSTSQSLNISIGGGGNCYLQRLYMTGTQPSIRFNQCTSVATVSMFVSDSSDSIGFRVLESSFITQWGGVFNDAMSFDSKWKGGVGLRGADGLEVGRCIRASVTGSYLAKADIYQTNLASFGLGSRVNGPAIFRDCSFDAATGIYDVASTAVTKFSYSGGIGLLLDSCGFVYVGSPIDVSNCGSHGIECNNSRLNMQAAVTGSGNTGAGVYAHNNSAVNIKNGSPPTLTGTVGNLSSDGTTQGSLWSTIDAGTSYADAAEMTMAKEI